MKIMIKIPMLPPRELNPNARVHWSEKARCTNEFRAYTKFYALEQTRFARPCLEKASVKVTLVIPRNRRKRDIDNLIASLKPAIDGCIDAGIIRDDNPDCLTWDSDIEYEVDKARAPLTVLEFKEP